MIVVLNRWRERYAEYERYIDHDACRVTYITTEIGQGGVPGSAAEVAIVDSLSDLTAVRAKVRELVARHGAPTGIVALKEDDLLTAAGLREEWDCPGPRRAELIGFRDKYLMCRAIKEAGLAVPAFAAAPDAGAARAFAREHGWPVILKPRTGVASAGVVRADGPADLADVPFDGEPMLVQEFVADPIYHVDGVFDGARLLTCRASRYINTCLGFRDGGFLGSVEEDDPEVLRAIGEAAQGFIGTLASGPTVFHLEVFVRAAGRDHTAKPDATECRFLETAARIGAAEIPFLWREIHGYDLMEAAWRGQLGQAMPAVPRLWRENHVAGWLLAPAPADRPCRISAATSMTGRPDGPYAEVVLRPGEILPAADSFYEHVGGRFRFRGSSTAAVESMIGETTRNFKVTAEPLTQVAA